MNIFRIIGDGMHFFSMVILLIKIWGTKNCRGISLKTQILYCVVFFTRYIDLFWNFHSLYNTFMKLVFLLCTSLTAYLMKFKLPYCKSYDRENDSFNVWHLIIPSIVLSFLWNIRFTPFEILWAFSLYLEAVVIVPQLVMVQKFAKEHSGSIENLTADYMFCLGGYRAMYAINWIYKYMISDCLHPYWDPIPWSAGIVQTAIYSDYLYYYFKARITSKNISLPI